MSEWQKKVKATVVKTEAANKFKSKWPAVKWDDDESNEMKDRITRRTNERAS